MIGKDTVLALREQIAPHPAPVLSLFLNVNPANPANERKAFVLRAREAMRDLQLSREYEAAVTRKLSQDHVIPAGRTMVIYSGEDPDELFSVQYMQTSLPLLDMHDNNEAVAHWGEPLTAPVLFALDQKERYAALYVSQEVVRCFEVFLGEIVELYNEERDLDTDEWRQYQETRHSSAVGVAASERGGASGGADVDSFDDRVDAVTDRFYRELLERFEKTVRDEDIDRIILMGTEATTGAVERLFSKKLQEKLVAKLPPPANPDAAAGEWLPLLTGTIAEAEARHEQELLDQIREKGVWGLQSVLALVRNRQVDVLVVPWTMDTTVHQAAESRDVSADPAELEALYPDDTHHLVPLPEVLPELVEQGNIRLEFVDGDAAERLREEFAGIAALRRW